MAKFKVANEDLGAEITLAFPWGGGVVVAVDAKKGFDSGSIKDKDERRYVENALMGNVVVRYDSGDFLPPVKGVDPNAEHLADQFPTTETRDRSTFHGKDLPLESVSVMTISPPGGGVVRGPVQAIVSGVDK